MTADRLTCPACGRPNSVKLKRCMYCGASLVVAADGRSHDPRSLEPRDARYVDRLPTASDQDFFLSTGPFAGSELDRLATYAELISRDPYSARLQMLDARPRVVAQGLSRQAARALLERFLAAGVRAAVSSEARLAQLPSSVPAIRAGRHAAGVEFVDDRGGRVAIPAAELLLVVLGKVTTRLTYREEETVARYHGGNLMVQGQARERREIRRDRHRSEKSHDHVLDLHPRAGPAVRLTDRDFDLGSAGIDPKLHRGAAFDRLVQRIREWAPGEFFDNSFESGLGEDRAAAPFLTAAARSDIRVADNLAAFDAHSRLYRVHLEGLLAGT